MYEKIRYLVYFDFDNKKGEDYEEVEAEKIRVDSEGYLHLESGIGNKLIVHAIFKNWKRVVEE